MEENDQIYLVASVEYKTVTSFFEKQKLKLTRRPLLFKIGDYSNKHENAFFSSEKKNNCKERL